MTAMILTRGADYGLRALIYLARRPGEDLVPLQELAAAIRTPPHFLGRILHRLVQAGMLDAQRGHHGGFHLRRPAREIDVAATIRAIDGPLRTFDCSVIAPCDLANDCRLLALLSRAARAFEDVLSRTTIADLVAHTCEIEPVASVANTKPHSNGGGC
jgi:Rrf2 family nitric oxide-sensitive transcriptional repressor